MDSVLRAMAIYLVLLVLFKVAGRRTLAELTTFDLVLLLVIATLIAIDIGFSLAKQRSAWFARVLDGGPTVLVEQGQVLHKRLKHARLDEGDILEAARSTQGLVELKQIRFAILERNGKISVIPFE